MALMRLRREDPRVVGSYRLHRRLGTGGMGVVYLGSDRRGQRVALKLIRAELAGDPEFRTRFAREVAAASRIRGGCTVRLVAADIDAERPWLATAYVPGPSLYKRVGDEGPLPWHEVASVGSALAEGLVHVHEAGVVHRDLKPSNILLSPKGPRIIDFGIAWSLGASTLTHVGTAVGSPGFLAPEQVRGAPVTPATDVFALGATLAYAACGDSPFGAGTSEVMLYRVVHEEPDLSGVPGPLAPLIRACLAKEPADRPGTVQLYERLRELAARGAAGRAAAGDGAAAADGRAPAGERRPPRRPSGAARPAPQRRPAGQPPTAPMPHGAGQHGPAQHGSGAGGHHSAPPGGARTGGRPRPSADRQRTPAPGRTAPGRTGPGRTAPERRRLLRQRLVVFVTVTAGVALAIAAAQGCRDRNGLGMPRPQDVRTGFHQSVDRAGGAAGGAAAVAPAPAASRPAAGAAADGALAASADAPPGVDWANRSYPDPGEGPAIRLRDGRAAPGGARVTLTTVLSARYRGAPAAVVVLNRTEGSVPVDLVELFGFSGGSPVLLAARSSAADPRAAAVWRITGGALIREERVPGAQGSTATRYTVRGDGTLEESWPGAGGVGTGGGD